MLNRSEFLSRVIWRHPGQLIWIALAYLLSLGWFSVPLTGDQKVYISIAQEMFERGEWFKPYLFGEPSYLKPPLQYWAILLSWKFFGFNLWATLFPSVVFLLITSYFLGEIAYLLRERKWFVNPGLVFAGTIGALSFGWVAQMEMTLCAFITAAWWAGLRYLKDPVDLRKGFWLWLAFGLAGVLGLVKSPLYSVLWVISYILYLLLSGEWELFVSQTLYQAGLFGVCIGSVWFVWIGFEDGQRFWDQYIVQETLGKSYGNKGSWWSLWGALIYYLLPYVLFLIPAFRAIGRSRHNGALIKLLIAWAIPFALFFTFHPYRIKPYLFPLVPLFCLFIDWGFFRSGHTRLLKKIFFITGLVLFFVTMFASIVLVKQFGKDVLPYVLFLVLSSVAVFWFSKKASMRPFAVAVLSLVLAWRLIFVWIGELELEPFRAEAANSANIVFLDENKDVWHEVGLISVATGRPIKRAQNLDELTDVLKNLGIAVLSDMQAQAYLNQIEAKLLAQGNKYDIQKIIWKRWPSRKTTPLSQMKIEMSRVYWILKLRRV